MAHRKLGFYAEFRDADGDVGMDDKRFATAAGAEKRIRDLYREKAITSWLALDTVAGTWVLEQTGGGCETWLDAVHEDGGGFEQMINTVGDCLAPLNLTDGPIVLTHYSLDARGDEAARWSREFKNLKALAKWEDTAEYVLPENGDGPEANGWTEAA